MPPAVGVAVVPNKDVEPVAPPENKPPVVAAAPKPTANDVITFKTRARTTFYNANNIKVIIVKNAH